jgi:hypothetical protein
LFGARHSQHVKDGDPVVVLCAPAIVLTTGIVQMSVPPTMAPRRIRSRRDIPMRRRICPSRCSSIVPQFPGGRLLSEHAKRGGELPGEMSMHVKGLGEAWKQ